MKKHYLKGRIISKGFGKGQAIVTKECISFFGGVDPKTGIVKERGHELEGKSVKNKVLVFPRGKGSSDGALKLYQMAISGTAPVAIINIETEGIIAIGAILGNIPLIDKLNEDPVGIIETGDFVRVNANEGTVVIISGT